MRDRIKLMLFLIILLIGLSSCDFLDNLFKPKNPPGDILPKDVELKSISKLETKYTSSSRTECINDVCVLSLYSGNTYANSKGQLIKDAPSLKDCEFCDNIKLDIKLDKDYPIEIIDYNTTAIKLCLKIGEDKFKDKDIDIKVYDKTDELNNIYFDKIKLKDNKDKTCVVLPFGFDKKVKWGDNSTELQIEQQGDHGDVIYEKANDDWDAAHDDTTGSYVNAYDTVNSRERYGQGDDYQIGRLFIPFNLTVLSGYYDIEILSAKVHFRVTNRGVDDNDGDDYIVIVGNTSQADVTSLVIADYNDCGAVDSPTEMSDKLDISSDVTAVGWYFFTLNTNGLAAINLDGWTLFGIREGHDVEDLAIATGDNNFVEIASSDTYLNVSFTYNHYLNITSPITSSTFNASEQNNMTVVFEYIELTNISVVNITSDVTLENVTIGGVYVDILQNIECQGTLDCSQYSTEVPCNNCSQCNWSTTGGDLAGVTKWIDGFETKADWTGWETDTYDFQYLTSTTLCINDANDDCAKYYYGDIGTDYLEYTGGDIDLSDCNAGSGNLYIAWVKEAGRLEADDCMYIEFSDDSGSSYGDAALIHCDDSPGATKNISIPDAYLVATMTLQIKNTGFDGYGENSYLDGFQIDCIEGAALAEECTEIGACSSCALNECDTNCSDAGCSQEIVKQFGWVADVGWQANVTVPELATCSLYDLYLNATYSGLTREDTQPNAIALDYPGTYTIGIEWLTPTTDYEHMFENLYNYTANISYRNTCGIGSNINYSLSYIHRNKTMSLNATAGDGYVMSSNGGTWADAHDDTDGAAYDDINIEFNVEEKEGRVEYTITRGFIPFNTSFLPDNAIIGSAKLILYCVSETNEDNDGNDFVTLVTTSQPNASGLTTDDFDEISTTEVANRIDLGAISVPQYIIFDFTESGLEAIDKTGISFIGMIEGHDLLDDSIADNTRNRLACRQSEFSTIEYRPQFNITYILPPPIMYSCDNSPFCTDDINPGNVTIGDNESVVVGINVNATEVIDTFYDVFWNITLADDESVKNSTYVINVTITEAGAGDSCDTTSIDCTENCIVDSLDAGGKIIIHTGLGTVTYTATPSNCNCNDHFFDISGGCHIENLNYLLDCCGG